MQRQVKQLLPQNLLLSDIADKNCSGYKHRLFLHNILRYPLSWLVLQSYLGIQANQLNYYNMFHFHRLLPEISNCLVSIKESLQSRFDFVSSDPLFIVCTERVLRKPCQPGEEVVTDRAMEARKSQAAQKEPWGGEVAMGTGCLPSYSASPLTCLSRLCLYCFW